MLKYLATLLTLAVTLSSAAETSSSPQLTPYSVKYHSEYKLGWFSFDIDATKVLSRLANDRWSLSFDAEASIATLKEYSEFTYRDGHIVPADYRYRSTGMIAEPDRTLMFIEGPGVVKDLVSGKTITDQWQTGLQDNLTYMQQGSLELAAGNKEFVIPVFETRRTKEYNFKVIGREEIKVPAGKFNTIKVQQVRKDKRREIFAWFADQPGYPMIRLTDKDKGKLKYRIEATELSY